MSESWEYVLDRLDVSERYKDIYKHLKNVYDRDLDSKVVLRSLEEKHGLHPNSIVSIFVHVQRSVNDYDISKDVGVKQEMSDTGNLDKDAEILNPDDGGNLNSDEKEEVTSIENVSPDAEEVINTENLDQDAEILNHDNPITSDEEEEVINIEDAEKDSEILNSEVTTTEENVDQDVEILSSDDLVTSDDVENLNLDEVGHMTKTRYFTYLAVEKYLKQGMGLWHSYNEATKDLGVGASAISKTYISALNVIKVRGESVLVDAENKYGSVIVPKKGKNSNNTKNSKSKDQESSNLQGSVKESKESKDLGGNINVDPMDTDPGVFEDCSSTVSDVNQELEPETKQTTLETTNVEMGSNDVSKPSDSGLSLLDRIGAIISERDHYKKAYEDLLKQQGDSARYRAERDALRAELEGIRSLVDRFL